MKICRFRTSQETQYGRVIDDRVVESVVFTPNGIERNPIRAVAIRDVDLLAPVEPTKIICVGRNYREHASELGNEVPAEPLLFFKPPSSLIGPGDTIQLPPASLTQRVDYEGELGVVIGRPCKRLSDFEDVQSYIRGYTCVNDVTARDLQKKDGQWTRAKGFDTFCPVGPFLITPDEVDASALAVTTRINREVKQTGNTRDFIFNIAQVLRYISQVMTLEPGDLISTGTPAGVGPMRSGDTVEIEISAIGVLSNRVA